MRNTGGQQPVALTVGSYRISGPYFYYGYDRGHIGALAPVPFWDNNVRLSTLRYDNQNDHTTCAATDRIFNLTVYISGYQDSPIRSGESISGDPFRFTVKVGQTVYLTFDPPPLQDISKKIKQVFTRSRKGGVVNAREGNAVEERWRRGKGGTSQLLRNNRKRVFDFVGRKQEGNLPRRLCDGYRGTSTSATQITDEGYRRVRPVVERERNSCLKRCIYRRRKLFAEMRYRGIAYIFRLMMSSQLEVPYAA